MKTELLFEKDGLYVVSKEAGDSCVPDKSVSADLQTHWETELKFPLHVLTRLDRPVSGLVLMRARANASGSEDVEGATLTKIYLAAVRGKVVKEGVYEDYLIHDKKINQARSAKAGEAEAKKAVMILKVLAIGENYSLCRIILVTGRHHQVRAQLAFRGTPVAGDTRYGAKRSLSGGRLGLHCIFVADTNAGFQVFLPPEACIPWTIFGDIGFYSKELVLDGLTGF